MATASVLIACHTIQRECLLVNDGRNVRILQDDTSARLCVWGEAERHELSTPSPLNVEATSHTRN